MRRVGGTLALALVLLAPAPALAARQAAIAIPGPLSGPLPKFTGAPVAAAPLPGPWLRPNKAMAPDGRNGSGLAAGNGAASPFPGPLGRRTVGASALQFGTCASMAFDPRDRLLAVCNGPLGPSLRLIDPSSLDTLASLALPVRPNADRTDTAGGTHFIVRADGTVLVPTNSGTLARITVGDGLRQTGAIDLKGMLGQRERPFAVAAGFDGRDWAVGNQGTVMAIPRDGGTPRALALREPVAEDLATDSTGAYVVTRDALYRLRAAADGTPRVVWRQTIPSGTPEAHSGRLHPGSGTPPVIIPGGFVAVADDTNPPRIVVMRITGSARRRVACTVPVFEGRPGSVEAHLVVAGRGIVVANAFGYDGIQTTEGGRTSTGGMARIYIGPRGCRVIWKSDQISVSAQAVVSRATGLLYTLVKPRSFPDAWNLAALDWRTGALRFTALGGEGLGFNSEGGAVVLGPDGAAYAGTFGGIVRFRDRG